MFGAQKDMKLTILLPFLSVAPVFADCLLPRVSLDVQCSGKAQLDA
jgi:hypothetical protein